MKELFGTLMIAALVSAGPAIVGCERKTPDTSGRSTASAPKKVVALPPGLFASATPAKARSVAEVKAHANASGEVVVRGRIGGRRQPFIDGVAMFLLADTSMKLCSELHGDGCPTPWD